MADDSRNLALMAWLGGWLAGPVLAAVAVFISREDRGSWHHRLAIQATVFWTALTLAWGTVIVIDVGFRSGPNTLFFTGWFITVATAITATIFAVIQILKRGSTADAE